MTENDVFKISAWVAWMQRSGIQGFVALLFRALIPWIPLRCIQATAVGRILIRQKPVSPSLGLLLFLWCLLSPAQASGAIQAQDDLGNRIELDSPAQRIISLAPTITEVLFHIGAGKQIVGADEFSNYPEAAKAITRVSNYAAANHELILSLKPDLVIAWYSGNGAQITERLRQLGLTLFMIEPRELDDIPDLFQRLGQLTGHPVEAAEKASSFRLKLTALRNKYSHEEPVSVFYQIWHEPLMSLNGKHLVSDVIRLCGGRNLFADAAPLVPTINLEAVIRANPQVIVASGSDENSPQWLDMWNSWPSIAAVKNHQVYFIPPDLMQRHSARILKGAEMLCDYLDQARQSAP